MFFAPRELAGHGTPSSPPPEEVARSKHRDGEAMRRPAGRPRAFTFYSTRTAAYPHLPPRLAGTNSAQQALNRIVESCASVMHVMRAARLARERAHHNQLWSARLDLGPALTSSAREFDVTYVLHFFCEHRMTILASRAWP